MNNTATAKQLVIERVFDAPRKLVFEAFTKAEHLKHWWGPRGFKIEVYQLNPKPGGILHYSMQSGESPKMFGVFNYREIASPERIVFINSFADEDANIVRPPFEDEWPWEIKNTFTFSESGNKTVMTLAVETYNATEEECRTFEENFPSMQEGYGGTFQQLDAYLRNFKA